MKLSPALTSYLQVAPMALVLLLFFGIPLLVVIAFSFFDYDGINTVPAFVWANYAELFASKVTLSLYFKTVYFAVIVWAITLVVGFTVAYFLVFHVRSILWQMALFLLCTVPFWTSNIIRMISWIPFLGRNGIFNQALMAAGVTNEPLEFLLFSDFAVIVAYVHLFTLFMIVPIFNSMARIDRADHRGRGGRRQQPCAHPVGHRDPAVEDRHRAGLDLRDHAGDGRLLRGQGHEREPHRVGGLRHDESDRHGAVSAGRGERGDAADHRVA